MKHARSDYSRIQDPTKRIPEDEPVFLLRGQDVGAPDAVRAYADIAKKVGAEAVLVQRCYDWADRMEKWQSERAVKIPDMPDGA